jgi:hypothetical protein
MQFKYAEEKKLTTLIYDNGLLSTYTKKRISDGSELAKVFWLRPANHMHKICHQ